jgi:hypothetical protein
MVGLEVLFASYIFHAHALTIMPPSWTMQDNTNAPLNTGECGAVLEVLKQLRRSNKM